MKSWQTSPDCDRVAPSVQSLASPHLVGADAMFGGWQRLNAENAKQFGIETPNWPPQAAQKSTWTEASRKGSARWLMWVAICSALACGFLIKGGTQSELLWAVVIGAANGTAVGFAVGPAAEKRAMILSGLFAGTPFYFIASSIFVTELIEARQLHRDLLSDVIPLVSAFLIVGVAISVAQGFRVRRLMRRDLA